VSLTCAFGFHIIKKIIRELLQQKISFLFYLLLFLLRLITKIKIAPMKKIISCLLVTILCHNCFAQWQLSLTLGNNELIAGISSPTDNVIWVVTTDFTIYSTTNGGSNWKKIVPTGLANDISLTQLFTVNTTTAFLGVNTNFTGVGPGIIYKTTDGGKNWTQVFKHKGNCDIKFAMLDDSKGWMSCNFDSFNGSVPSGQSLYYTTNGGSKWNIDSIHDPTKDFIQSLVINGKKLAIGDGNFFYYSTNKGRNWTKQKYPSQIANTLLQFEDSNYIVTNGDISFSIIAKRPGSNKWTTSTGYPNGLITTLVLDGNECWTSEAFDALTNYYSSDSAKTFTPFTVDASAGFQFLVKARNGRTLVGGTPSFMPGRVWINKRSIL